MNARRRGFVLLVALLLLILVGAGLTAGTVAVVSSTGSVEQELAALRARAAALSAMAMARARVPGADVDAAPVRIDLAHARAQAEVSRDDAGMPVLDVRATGEGGAGVEVSLRIRLPTAHAVADQPLSARRPEE